MFLPDRKWFRTRDGENWGPTLLLSMKVVCGTDFSMTAARAADAAAALAARTDDTLLLVHVLDLSRYEAPSKELVAYLLEARQGRLTRETQRLRKAAASIEGRLLQGHPAEELAKFSTRSRADLIVVSSRGHTAPIWWPVGSVAERVAFHSSVPTMVVRSDQAVKAWITGKRALRVFVGYGFSGASDTALQWVRRLEQIGPCEITVAALAWPPQKSWRLGIGDHLSSPSAAPKAPASLRQCLVEKCEKLLGGRKPRFRLETACGRPDAQLMGLARASKADLVVVAASSQQSAEQTWLGSVSRGLLYYSPFNVVCVNTPYRHHSDAVKISQAAMNSAAITGPSTKPLRPKTARPPRVEKSTT